MRSVKGASTFSSKRKSSPSLGHPNIVDVADVGEHGGRLSRDGAAHGESLGRRIQQSPLTPRDAARIVREVVRGLAVAHNAGIVHRDIKPENMFLARGSAGTIPKLLDFGVSKVLAEAVITLSGDLFGTPAYMSPSKPGGRHRRAHRSVVARRRPYEALTGKRPFSAENYQALLPRICDDPHAPLPPHVPASLRAVVDRCLAKPRIDRYQSAAALLDGLDRAIVDMEATQSDLVIESVNILPSLAPVLGGPRSPEALPIIASDETFRPSMHAVSPLPRGRRTLGVLAGLGLVCALIIAWRVVSSRPSSADYSRSPAIEASVAVPAPPPPSIAPAEVPVLAPSRAASADIVPLLPVSAKPISPKAPRSGSAKPPVTRVNSAGF